MSRKRLAVLSTHPIQYHAPWFRALAAHPDLELEVLFCHQATQSEQAGAGFGVDFDWDVPLLDGYSSRFLKNVSSNPTIGEFAGLDTPEVKELIRRERYDAVIVNGWHFKSAWQAFRACWKTGTPVMARGDSTLYNSRTRLKKVLKWPYYRWFIPKLDACLAVGKWSREYYLHYGARADRVFQVPHVIDEELFRRESERLEPQRSEIRKAWGLAEEQVVFLFAGKFIEVKRPLDFIRAVELASGRGARVAGLMAGDGPLRATCEEYVSQHQVPVSFTGFLNQSQIARSYIASDALVLSSGSETWGMVVNEAMACGRPCIVSDHVGCAPDMVIREETGNVFPAGDTEALAELLARYAKERERLRAMGQRAREILAQQFSVKAAVDGTLRAIEAVSERER
jgi:glycosyltransferase involved in cell wall biosynthesis